MRTMLPLSFTMLCALAALAAAGPAAAFASSSPSPAPSAAASTDSALSAKDAGTIDGRVSSIDYKSGNMTVDVVEGGVKKSYDVVVVPGTTIQGQKDFHTIADVKKGAHVQVLMSRHGTTNTAQIIRLL